MPSFDVVSEVDKHELTNAVDQATRELSTRFDFKGSKARFERSDNVITIIAEGEFQVKQLLEILQNKLTKRGIDIDCLDYGTVSQNLAEAPSAGHRARRGRQRHRTGCPQAHQGKQSQNDSTGATESGQGYRQESRRFAGHHRRVAQG